MFAVRNHHLNVISEGWATSRAAATTIAPAAQHTAAWAGGRRVQVGPCMGRWEAGPSKPHDARDRRESEPHERAYACTHTDFSFAPRWAFHRKIDQQIQERKLKSRNTKAAVSGRFKISDDIGLAFSGGLLSLKSTMKILLAPSNNGGTRSTLVSIRHSCGRV